MARIAFFTFGILVEAPGHEKVQGFFDLVPSVFEAAYHSAGFIAAAQTDSNEVGKTFYEQNWLEWGKFVTPRFYMGSQRLDEITAVQTLSLWHDLQSVHKFAYRDYHAEALRHRKEWGVPHPQYPAYVSWWVSDDEIPTWEDACKRHEHLHDKGSTAYAFDFKAPFDAEGNPLELKKKS